MKRSESNAGELTRASATRAQFISIVDIARQPKRQCFVRIDVGRAQIGQAGGCDDAARYASGERVATRCDRRASAPECIADGGVRRARKCVEGEIRNAIAGQMRGLGILGANANRDESMP